MHMEREIASRESGVGGKVVKRIEHNDRRQ
jgi:hypothetical protein